MNKLLFILLTVSALMATVKTTSNVTFEKPYDKSQNEYGDSVVYQKVKINTRNFKIDNFWSNFSKGAQNKSNYTNISTTGTIKLTTENSFTCKDGGLLEEGCSGQKPFLLNNNTLTNPNLQKDRNGAALPAGEYRIPFDAASNYDSAHNDAFYALDVYRDTQYYEPPANPEAESDKPKNFFGYIKAFFKNYFSKDTAVYGNEIKSPQQRDRYMANIIFGLQKRYRIAQEDPITTTEINAADADKKVTLLDYNSQIVEETTGCNGLFFSYDPDSITCKTINFFGISQWMPFIETTDDYPEVKIKSDSVLEDTETTLLTLAGKLDNTNYVERMKKIDPATGKSFLQEMFKPMTFMMGSMFRFFFGENSKTLTETVAVDFDFTNHMPLTFIETDGEKALDFIYFQLLGLESVYGTEVESCKVKQTKNFFIFPIGWDTKTFTEGVPTNTKFDMESGFLGSVLNDSSDYNELNTSTKKKCIGFGWAKVCSNHDIVNLSTDDWLDWCKRNQGKQKKGIFGRTIDTFKNIVSTIVVGKNRSVTYDEQIDKVLRDDDWSVVEYKEKVHKGLILHLKKINIENIDASTVGTTTKFKMMNTSRGH